MRFLVLHFPRLGVQLVRRAAPALHGHPVALSQGEGDPALLAAVSVEATAAGIEPGMTVLQARQRVPGLRLEPDNAAACLDELEELMAILRTRATTNVAIVSRNAIALDLAGLEARFADEGAEAQGIATHARSWTGLDVRAAVASNLEDALRAASTARRFAVICSEAGRSSELPGYEPISVSMAGAEWSRAVRPLSALMAEYPQSYRSIEVEIERGSRRERVSLKPKAPVHTVGEVVSELKRLDPARLEGAGRVRVTLAKPGPLVAVDPWRAASGSAHELNGAAIPIQRRLLRAS
jgi:hypothetical protein